MSSFAMPSQACRTMNQPTTPVSPRVRIVFVDDEPGILEIWKHILLDSGYDVECCQDAASALEVIAAGCDCVITDYHMPHMNGLELIRAARPRTNARFILLTANASDALTADALDAGADCVVHKPTSAPLMLQKIASLSQ